MEISILSLLEGAKRATDTVAIIDVFRAFTTAVVALANGASSIVMVRIVQEALALRDAGIGQICMGEVGGRAPDGFDFGNSPFETSGVDFGGQTIIQRTSAGTQGIVAAANRAARLYAASLVTADATVRALLSGVRRVILAGGEVARFRDPTRPYLHPQDVDIALDIDRYDFAVRVDFEDGRPVARVETPAITMSKSPI
jgi:2-phosphosulfolactate phosphatase